MAVHLALDGEGPAPIKLWVWRLTQAFHCTASEAYAEWQRWPPGWLEEMLEAGSYAEAKALVDATKDETTLPDSLWITRVHEIEGELVLRQIRAEEARQAGG